MTSEEIRQSFFDFFAGKAHEVVSSASLMPESPNLLFTNAGMNQFVPYFLGDRKAPYPRAADTQKCIRAGGKHNDLEDVGLDTYHHTYFEMLGNWSFGDYFKTEAIEWAWELLTEVWLFPKERLYATVYNPGEGEPADFDQDAHDLWTVIFEKEGLDPTVHVINGGKKDNFWMMGETGPCGPCSELHIDLTPEGDTAGQLVNADSNLCIEIWNLVFIQFNADKEGGFSPLAAKHVDTGMGFERVAAAIQSTNGFSDFSKTVSNYDTDVFRPLFDELEKLSGKTYSSSIPVGPARSEQEEVDIAFRVIGDHLRALSFSISDGIMPGNSDRNYVLRRILRRAIRYGRNLGFSEPFFHKLVGVLVEQMGGVFPELINRRELIEKTLLSEEESFNRTLDRGIELFRRESEQLGDEKEISGEFAFRLYDTYGFPLDLTQLMARERGLSVDQEGFDLEMEMQRTRAREAHKTVEIKVKADGDDAQATKFLGYERENLTGFSANCQGLVRDGDNAYLIFDQSPFYAEMGGQVGDSGTVEIGGETLPVGKVSKDVAGRFLHPVKDDFSSDPIGQSAVLNVDLNRRLSIQRHHTATHVLHWALRKVLGDHVRQAGSLVEPSRLRFDFSHFEGVNSAQIEEIEGLANENLLINDAVESVEISYAEKPDDIVAFFGDKYGDVVRVVDLGGWSKELCGGTHVQSAGEIGFIKIISESAIAAGTRRIDAVAGSDAYALANERFHQFASISQKLACKPEEVFERIVSLQAKNKELEKNLRAHQQKGQANLADELIAKAVDSDGIRFVKAIVREVAGNDLRGLVVRVSKATAPSVTLLVSIAGEKATMICISSDEAIAKGHKAGEILRDLATLFGGKGGGKPDFAMGGAPAGADPEKNLADFAFPSQYS
ncbi:MAG: alanine--tRNA ligase [Opitutae bacterium]|nr:alanine--tRNA ligase [Opitutae bacterium]